MSEAAGGERRGFLFLPGLSDGRGGRGFCSKAPYQPGICLGCSGGSPHLAEPPSYRQGVQRGSLSRPKSQGVCPGECGPRHMQMHACSPSLHTSRSAGIHLCAWRGYRTDSLWVAGNIARRPGPEAGLRTTLLLSLLFANPIEALSLRTCNACVKPWVLQGNERGT